MNRRLDAAPRRRLIKRALILVALLLAVALRAALAPEKPSTPPDPATALTVEAAYADHLSEVMVLAHGRVQRNLPDDNDGSRHQRLILELASGHTVLVAHNIDLAERVPAAAGDQVCVYGQYEWNDRGGVLHWTHHDPAGRRTGGWIEHERQRYR